jgi:3',5'-cyclic AMP phosphodiesterase CpdA
VTPVRVLLVSDTHLSPAAPEAEANWDAVLHYVAETAPDVVIHLGDLSLDGAHNRDDLYHARRQLDRLPAVWHAVPGNHDIGDNPWPGGPEDSTVDAARCQRWLDIVGADHWSLTINGWTLLAVNAQLPGSGLEAEARQWSWLEEQLSALGPGQRVALLTHKPVTAADAELASSPGYRFWPPSARDLLAGLLGETPLALVLSGHVHSTVCSASMAPITCGCRPPGRFCPTRRSRSWEPSGAGSSRSIWPAARHPNRCWLSRRASPS